MLIKFRTKLSSIIENHNSSSIYNVSAGLSPALLPTQDCNIDLCSETVMDVMPPHGSLFHVSPLELLSTREYVMTRFKEDKVGPSNLLFGSLFFMVKRKTNSASSSPAGL